MFKCLTFKSIADSLLKIYVNKTHLRTHKAYVCLVLSCVPFPIWGVHGIFTKSREVLCVKMVPLHCQPIVSQ